MPQVETDGATLSYETAGQGTALVLLHGLGGDRHVWDEDAPCFAAHHQVVRPDLRGFGDSAKPPGPYSTEMYARDLLAVLDACEIGTAHLLGISMGGVVAQRFALDFPERVRSLILISTSSEVGPQATASWRRLADRIESRGFDERSADASRAVSTAFAARHPDTVAELARRNAACDPRAYAAAARAVSDYHFTAEIDRLTMPVLILQGLDDQLTPPGGAVKMSRALRYARLLMVAEAGHNLPLEQPVLFRQTVSGFLSGVDLMTSIQADRES